MRAVLVALFGLVVVACGADETRACTPGVTRSCACIDGRAGVQSCIGDGSGFGSCECAAPMTDGGAQLCVPGSTRGCSCSDGSPGEEVCDGDGLGYGSCACEPPRGCTARESADADGVFVVLDDCTGDTICICPPGALGTCEGTGECGPAFGRRYRLAPLEARVPERGPTGECWDPGCGLPDLFAIGSVDGVVVVTSAAVSDSLGASWSGAVGDATVAAGSTLRFDVYDDDPLDDPDGALACVAAPVTAEMLRSRRIYCTGELGSSVGGVVPL